MHITYGLALMLAFGAGTGVVGFNVGVVWIGWRHSRKEKDRQGMRIVARLHEINNQ